MQRAPLVQGQIIPEYIHVSRDEILARAQQHISSMSLPILKEFQEGASPVKDDAMESFKIAEESEDEASRVKKKLLEWVTGVAPAVGANILPEIRERVWRTENELKIAHHLAARKIQARWKVFWQRKRYITYSLGRVRHKETLKTTSFSLWHRVKLQRPGARYLLSFWCIQWRVETSRRQIAREKGKDLRNIWLTVQGKRHLKAWLKCGSALRLLRIKRGNRGMEPWKAYRNDEKIWQDQRKRCKMNFIYMAFRVLYFWAQSSKKLRRRAFKLFRLEEESINTFNMPIERFRGTGLLFNCQNILESFQRRDWYERRTTRNQYIRLAPRCLDQWKRLTVAGKKTRFAANRYDMTIMKVAIEGFGWLTAKDEHGERLKIFEDSEEEAEDEAGKNLQTDRVKQLETDIETLADLVDHEHRENMRRSVKEEKRKMLIKIKFDALRKERELVQSMPQDYTNDIAWLEEEILRRDDQYIQKQKETIAFFTNTKVEEGELWEKAVDRIRILFYRGTEILTRVFDKAQLERELDVFYICWCMIRRPAFNIRMKRIFNKAQIRRLLVICAWHHKMDRSIHKYRPLRVLYSWWLQWLKLVEYNYLYTTPQLKEQVRRKYELQARLSDELRAMVDRRPAGDIPSKKQMFDKMILVFTSWLEVQVRRQAARNVVLLSKKRLDMILMHKIFQFLKHNISWRSFPKRESSRPYMEIAAAMDIRIWKKCFYAGKNYADLVGKVEIRRKRWNMMLVRESNRLAPLLTARREVIDQRLVQEEKLLIRYCAEEEEEEEDDAQYSSGITLSAEFPPQYLGTVMNLRRSEILKLIEACDELARKARHEFDSTNIAFRLSEWLFKIRCTYLPRLNARGLPRSSRYWQHIRELFAAARACHAQFNINQMSVTHGSIPG
mmetsp:Transcript_2321/g.3725  ORF Transcript_2321/g.3725 Transcript_2321/m.3725 type:complete len:896 (-) Transcript_2321:1172-3859(-)